MLGLMQDWPLTTDRIVAHAARWYGESEVVWRGGDGLLRRHTYAEIRAGAARLTNALRAFGIVPGDRIATLAMNGVEHLEAWYAITGMGAVCHSLNPRLFSEQIAWIINHAEDRLIFADAAFSDLVAKILPGCPTVERVIFIDGDPEVVASDWSTLAAFREGQSEDCAWGGFDELTAAGLCYTSGTTGDPKGVLYSHRSNFLHTLTTVQPDVFNISMRDSVLAVVPMYHANAWALTYAAPLVGAKLVLPGPRLDSESILDLMDREQVTVTAGVPTVWLSLLQYLEQTGRRPATLERVIVGGAACPETLLRGFAELDIEVVTAWGMTELSPVGGVGVMTPAVLRLPFEEQIPVRLKQGRSPCGVEIKLVGDDGKGVPHDGRSAGVLRVRGPAVASGYYRLDRPVLDEDGFFDTGDIATIDPQGFMRITDRVKDIIKSGGEWISSIDVENAATDHPAVAIAAVIAVPHERWGERPRLCVELKPNQAASADELLDFLRPKLARWWLPDEVIFFDRMPVGATGKIDKKALRLQFLEKAVSAAA